VLVILAALLSLPAHADVVNPPPEDCPSGAVGTAGHGGEWCTPDPCVDGQCALGTTCETTGLCVLEEERPCGGQSSGTPCTFVYREAFGPCDDDGACDEGTCVTDEYCVDEAGEDTADGDTDTPTSPDEGSGCSCSTGAGASMVFLLGLLPLLWIRRQR
jgi:MYXO-CTERM domain-containing protein